jgi:thymidylate synthase
LKEHPENQYIRLIEKIIRDGSERKDRTGVGTKAIFGEQMTFDLSEGFPAFTTKKLAFKTAVTEILWMLSGSSSLRELLIHRVKIWTEWPLARYRRLSGDDIDQDSFEMRILTDDAFNEKWGDLGPIYGRQWRRWRTADGREVDQVSEVIRLIRENPSSRRILWEGWNVGDLEEMTEKALPPCHKHYQFFVRDGHLDGAVVQRSADAFLGLPFNICNLAIVTHMLAAQTGLKPGKIVWFGLDVHLYLNHMEAAKIMISRVPKPLPSLIIKRHPGSLFDYKPDDFSLKDYEHHPTIKAQVAV